MAPETSQDAYVGPGLEKKNLQMEAQGGSEVPRGVPRHDFGPKVETSVTSAKQKTQKIVYASRIPPRPHEALRLGGFEEGRGRCLEKSIIIIVILQSCNIEILKE